MYGSAKTTWSPRRRRNWRREGGLEPTLPSSLAPGTTLRFKGGYDSRGGALSKFSTARRQAGKLSNQQELPNHSGCARSAPGEALTSGRRWGGPSSDGCCPSTLHVFASQGASVTSKPVLRIPLLVVLCGMPSLGVLWRRERDSNPRCPFGAQRFSRSPNGHFKGFEGIPMESKTAIRQKEIQERGVFAVSMRFESELIQNLRFCCNL